jgi:hypothetical protein
MWRRRRCLRRLVDSAVMKTLVYEYASVQLAKPPENKLIKHNEQ